MLSSVVMPATDSASKDLISHGHFKRARIELENRLAKSPRDADALVLMARVKLAYRQTEEATAMLQQAILLEPKNSDALLYLGDAYSRRAEKAGWVEKVGWARKIKAELQQAVMLDPKSVDALEGMMEFYLEAPSVLGGSSSQAEEVANRIFALDAVRGNLAQGRIAAHQKRFAQCEAFYQKAVQVAPQSYEALIGDADLYLQDHWSNSDKAAEYARKASQIDPSRADGYVVLAQVLAATERWRELEELLTGSERRVSDNLVPYYVAGRTLLVNEKDPARAERYFRKYLSQQEPEGDTPGFAAAHWRLGSALDRENRKEEALRELQAAVEMDPDLKEAQTDLKRLKSH